MSRKTDLLDLLPQTKIFNSLRSILPSPFSTQTRSLCLNGILIDWTRNFSGSSRPYYEHKKTRKCFRLLRYNYIVSYHLVSCEHNCANFWGLSQRNTRKNEHKKFIKTVDNHAGQMTVRHISQRQYCFSTDFWSPFSWVGVGTVWKLANFNADMWFIFYKADKPRAFDLAFCT